VFITTLSSAGHATPFAAAALVIGWVVRGVIRELRALIVQLYALRDSKADERAPIIKALAELFPKSVLRKLGPGTDPPSRNSEETGAPGPDRGT
jgi:hypothetical protein